MSKPSSELTITTRKQKRVAQEKQLEKEIVSTPTQESVPPPASPSQSPTTKKPRTQLETEDEPPKNKEATTKQPTTGLPTVVLAKELQPPTTPDQISTKPSSPPPQSKQKKSQRDKGKGPVSDTPPPPPKKVATKQTKAGAESTVLPSNTSSSSSTTKHTTRSKPASPPQEEEEVVLVEKEDTKQKQQQARVEATYSNNEAKKIQSREYKKKEKACKYRPSAWAVIPGEHRGQISRKAFFITVMLEPKVKGEESIFFPEGVQVLEFKQSEWQEVVLMYLSANGTHLQLLCRPLSKPTSDLQQIPLDSIMEIRPHAKDYMVHHSEQAFQRMESMHEITREKLVHTVQKKVSSSSPLHKNELNQLGGLLTQVENLTLIIGTLSQSVDLLRKDLRDLKESTLKNSNDQMMKLNDRLFEILIGTRK